ncbi:MAG: ribonuclease D, partial [Alphaproteobacteria bacterium]|nr:ribonuclease D [Alphaproteobacteria bacterium]
MNIHLHKDDLPDGISFKDSLAIDTETLGLNPLRDRLCLIQMCDAKSEDVHL